MSVTQNPVNWFEIPANDLDRAKAFYEAVLEVELTFNEMNGFRMAWFPMAEDTPGAAGTLVNAEGYTPSHQGTVVYFPVADIDAALQRVEAQDGKTLVPKMSIGPYGYIAQFEDSEGNRVGLHTGP